MLDLAVALDAGNNRRPQPLRARHRDAADERADRNIRHHRLLAPSGRDVEHDDERDDDTQPRPDEKAGGDKVPHKLFDRPDRLLGRCVEGEDDGAQDAERAPYPALRSACRLDGRTKNVSVSLRTKWDRMAATTTDMEPIAVTRMATVNALGSVVTRAGVVAAELARPRSELGSASLLRALTTQQSSESPPQSSASCQSTTSSS